MVNKGLQKFLAGSFLFGILVATTVAPMVASAQLGSLTSGFSDLARVPTILKDEGLQAALNPFDLKNILKSVGSVGGQACDKYISLDTVLTTVQTALSKLNRFGGLALLTDNAALSIQLEALHDQVSIALQCYKFAEMYLKGNLPGVSFPLNFEDSLVKVQKKETALNNVTTNKAILQKKFDDLDVQIRIATEGFWKALLTKALLTLGNSLMQRIANGLMAKFKVNNYGAYADALVGQVYRGERILSSTDDKKTQTLLHGLMTNPLLGKQMNGFDPRIMAGAQVASNNFDNMDIRDPNWYAAAANQATCKVNVYCADLVAKDQQDSIMAQARADAASNVSQGAGYKDPWNCTGSVAQQQQFKQQTAAATDKLINRSDLYESLKKAKDGGQKVSDSDLNQALKDYLQSADDLTNIGDKVDTGSLLKVCNSIASPAMAINLGIDKIFQHFSKNIGDFKDQNMPFFINFVSQVATSFANDLVFGGNKTSLVLQEHSNVSTAVKDGLSFANDKIKDVPQAPVSTPPSTGTGTSAPYNPCVDDPSYAQAHADKCGGVLGAHTFGPIQPRGPVLFELR